MDKTFYESTILLDVFHRNIGEFLRMAPRIEDGIAIHLETETILQTEEFAKFRVTGERGPIEHRPVRKRISSAATNKGGLY